ncbi:hypothetical protein OF829_03460 [Sphingomonas sp. LB-2]|uniref:hypothetical protein n=1 Tax=Sphingomonas caeni TaxID=2984949 RepID=UPI00222F581E|nr:hypothetical protein [Sphingomonas caeni]MCW3846283.1 hypothetical protein [Sphingomonas caeni]
MHYVTVFDAASWSAMTREWLSLLMGALFVATAGPAIYGDHRIPGQQPWQGPSRTVARIVFPFIVLVLTFLASGPIGAAILSRKALLAGNCTVMEGKVRNFRPQPFERGYEAFDLNGTHFAYTPRQLWGFRRIAARGGPLHEGVQVRLCNFDGAILKLEVAR